MSSEHPISQNIASTSASSSSSTNVRQQQQPEQRFTCSVGKCKYDCSTQYALDQHVKILHIAQLKCELCDFGAHLPFEMDKHMKKAHKIEQTDSQQGGSNDFNDSGPSSGPSASQQQPVPSKCSQLIAEDSFTRLPNESQEAFTLFLQSLKPNTVICPICRNTLCRSDSLTRHVKLVHAGEKPYVCLLCFERFLTYDDLKTHKGTKGQE